VREQVVIKMENERRAQISTKESGICDNCPNNCCIGVGRIWVTREELNRLRKFQNLKVETEGRLYRVSVAKEGDSCPYFLDDRCTNYDQRPFDCRLYPLVIDEISETDEKVTAFYRFHRRCPQVRFFRSKWHNTGLEEIRAWLKAIYPERKIELLYREDGFLKRNFVRLKRLILSFPK
jgi:Fe-S-cluster containining protein